MRSRSAVLVLAVSLMALPALARENDHAAHAVAKSAQQGQMQSGMMEGHMMRGGMMGHMMGMHVMSVTVTALDAKTGLVGVSAGKMALKFHFPPASLADVKVGDKLSVHLGFSKF